jgi:hypothetical protein
MNDSPNCFKLFRQYALYAASFARFSAGSSIAARIAMIAMTTNSSIRVNLLELAFAFGFRLRQGFAGHVGWQANSSIRVNVLCFML